MSKTNNTSFILVTAEKNEEKSLPNLIKSVINQSFRPVLWVIVNDASTDQSPQIINKACKKYKWIKKLDLTAPKEDLGYRFSYVCRAGFKYALKYCKKNYISYEFIGLLDADILLENNYYENLIKHFLNNPSWGIISGGLWNYNGRTYIHVKVRPDLPLGAARFWRKKCFLETDGYLLTYAPDSVSNIKAKLKGWKTKRLEEIKVRQTRMTRAREGLNKGFKRRGEASYFVYLHPIIIVLKFLNYMFRHRISIGIAYITGYFESFINKKRRINDEDIIKFNRSMHMKTLINYWLKKSYSKDFDDVIRL